MNGLESQTMHKLGSGRMMPFGEQKNRVLG